MDRGGGGLLAVLTLHLLSALLAGLLVCETVPIAAPRLLRNLVSNTVVVLVAFSVSAYGAVAALAFLIFIHKLEYFLDAHIVGSQIHARAWELLIAVLLMEAAFGIGGSIAAPIYYANLKDELAACELI